MDAAPKKTQRDAEAGWARGLGGTLDLGLQILVATSALAIGGMHPVGQAATAFASITLLLGVAGLHAASGQRWRWQPASGVLVAMALLTLFRASSASGWLAGAAEREVFGFWDAAPRGTVAPGRAPLAALRLIGAASLLQAWTVRFRGRGGTRGTAIAVVAAVGLTALVGLAHGLTEARLLYGAYEPHHVDGLHVTWAAPFINPNQAGAVYGLGAVLLTAIAWARPALRAGAVLVIVAFALSTELLFQAHAAALATLVALVVFAVLVSVPPMSGRRYARLATAVVLASAAVTAPLLWFVAPKIESAGVAAQKAQVWQDALVPSFSRALGWGRGAFADLAGQWSSRAFPTRFSYIESAPLDAAFDHGWVLFAAFVVAVGYGLRRRLLMDWRSETDLRAAVAALTVFVIIEGLSGAALESDGYRLPVLALLGLALGRSEASRRDTRHAAAPLVTVAVAIACTGAAIPGLVRSVALGASSSSDYLSTVSGVIPRDELSSLLPADALLLEHEATRELEAGNVDRAESIVAHLVRVVPGRAVTWDLAVDVAVARGRRAEACAAAAHLAGPGANASWLVGALQRIDENSSTWTECVPGADARAALFDGFERADRHDEALALALGTLNDDPSDVAALRVAVDELRRMGQIDYAVRLAERLVELGGGDTRTTVTLARLLVARDRYSDALQLVRDALAQDAGNVELQVEELGIIAGWDSASLALERTRFVSVYHRVMVLAGQVPALAERRLRYGAQFFEKTGELSDAEDALQALRRLRPDDPRVLLQLADIEERRGRPEAAEEHRQLAAALRRR
ncbi:MAG: hypothetical protein H6698_00700 [Myxococcales bacterium]|nr:hypothetical protein [Myxococcales bacterium]MCB9531957.1 hypothetical protein [Myxococcales bacterium]MCB9532830.1 hypothetical protein [Myxococcales bacterium]